MRAEPVTGRPWRATDVRYPTTSGSTHHYESVYLVAHDPAGGRAAWIRYTVHRPAGEQPRGSVWLTLFERGVSPRALKVTLPTEALSAPVDAYLAIGPSRIGPHAATGELAAADSTATWDLKIEASERALHHLPASWLYDAPVPRTKAVSPHPAARFSGGLTFDGERLDLAGWTGMVGHNWGTQHAERWIWLHGAQDGAWLDLALARVRLGSRLLPWMAVGALAVDGQRRRLGGLTHPPKVTEQVDACEVRVRGAKALTVSVHARSPRDAIVAWPYADPDGTQHTTMNSSVADLDVEISGWTGAPARLSVQGRGVYELGLPAGDHGIPPQPFSDG